MTRMMTTVMMKSCNHQLMRWTRLFSLWIRSKVKANIPLRPAYIESLQYYCYSLVCKHIPGIFLCFLLNLALQASDPLRFQNLTQTLDFHYQALANGVAQHAELRRADIEKERMEKAAVTAAP
jgi:hypothetical protein